MTILTVTLNAAIDKRYDVTDVHVGEVQRVTRVRAGAGGKGLNVARGARLCGQAVIATGFVAGFAGQFITSQVEEQGIREEFLRVPGESRTCINIIDAAGRSTEFLEPGVTVEETHLAQLLARFQTLLGEADVVTLSGSAPSGCPDDVYLRFVEAAGLAGRPVILDTSGALLRAGLAASPTVVKPNREELAALAGSDLHDLGDVIAAARSLCAQGPEWVVVSLGADGALVLDHGQVEHLSAPAVQAVDTVGAGDAFCAALTVGLARSLTLGEATRKAVAAGAVAVASAGAQAALPLFDEL